MKIILKIITTLVISFIAIIPALFIAGAYGFFDPQGFLQSFFVIGVGVYFLGWTQFVLAILWSVLMFLMWKD